MKVQIIGGFLGAGKTTLARTAALALRARGERVAIVTNDQGRSLVDTQLCRTAADAVLEITGGCFCCRYPELESALRSAEAAGATTTIAEAVGSCTDLVATVLAPLADRERDRWVVAPLAVVVDPWRLHEIACNLLPTDVAFLFRKQIEEADVVLVSRADLAPPDVTTVIRTLCGDIPVIPVSGRTGIGVDEWLRGDFPPRSAPLTIDYDRYAAAEALLGWCNARVRLRSDDALEPAAAIRAFLGAVVDAPIAHVKVTNAADGTTWGAAVRRGGPVTIDGEAPAPTHDLRLIINARAALSPAALDTLIHTAVTSALPAAEVTWEEFECFSPSPPKPTHRYATRALPTIRSC